MLFNAVQSATDFSITDRLSISCALVKGTVKNLLSENNLCLPRALVAAYAYAVRGQTRTGKLHDYWISIWESNGRVQKEAAEELVKLSNTEVPSNGCGIEEVHRFEKFFSTHATAIVVYNFSTFGRGNPPLYDGTRFVIDTYGGILHTLRIIYYERINHFQPILNLVGKTGTRRYCIPCNEKYWHVEDRRCSNKCYKCLTIPSVICLKISNSVHCVLDHFLVICVMKIT